MILDPVMYCSTAVEQGGICHGMGLSQLTTAVVGMRLLGREGEKDPSEKSGQLRQIGQYPSAIYSK